MMQHDPGQVLQAVRHILAQVTGHAHPAAGPATLLDELDGLDSLRLLETVALAEEHLGVVVDTGGLGQIATLGDIVRLLAAGRPA